jgi:tetratricopeptide (TPR) repeat protein
VRAAIAARELQRSRSQPLPSLRCYTLLIAAVALMHRLTLRDFEEAKRLLETLIERSDRLAVPRAWLANWHVLRVQQGWSDDSRRDAQIALQSTARALDNDPQCSLALTIDGFVHTNLLKRLDIAEERYNAALEANPNEARAWLLRGTLRAFRAEGSAAISDTTRAIRLSPLDPHRYFYDSLAGCACLAAQQYDRALELAMRSLRANRTHTSTLRTKAVAEWRLGLHEEARATVRELIRLEPNLTIREYLRRTPAADFPTGRDWADALHAAGVPN